MSKRPAAGRIVFKILPASEWRAACACGHYSGSADDARDGFIHLSAGHQLAGTAAKHFRHQPSLILVAFEATALEPELIWEQSRGGDFFPHLYAPMPTACALWTKPLPLGDEGIPVLPDLQTC